VSVSSVGGGGSRSSGLILVQVKGWDVRQAEAALDGGGHEADGA